MKQLESLKVENIKHHAFSWWQSKSKEEKLTLETQFAIIAPAIGISLGTLLVFIVL